MAKGFSLSTYPWSYLAKFEEDGKWTSKLQEKEHLTPEEENKLPQDKLNAILEKRNSFPELPLVNYTTQYGLGCFEGMKAFPQKDGSIKLFRPDENAKRFRSSMEGLRMPPFPIDMFVEGAKEIVRMNKKIGFAPEYDSSWEKDNFMNANSIYLRPFSYSEGAIGLGQSKHPWVVMVATPVGSYFRPGSSDAVTTNRIRATQNGTGWIKCDSNYVIPILAKKEAEAQGYMEVVFLDAKESTYIEEGSSCNIFFVTEQGVLITPELGDTILPGITRKSILQLAKDNGIKTEERKISIQEVLENGTECFVTGTAAGITPFQSLTHKGIKKEYKNTEIGELLLRHLKGIQFGILEDKHGWMFSV